MSLGSHLAGALRFVLRLRPRHLPYAPLAMTLIVSEMLGRLVRKWLRPKLLIRPLSWDPGLSILIPERGGVEMLSQCLAHLAEGLGQVDEPSEVIVVVNGSDIENYLHLQQSYPEVKWIHEARPLGFTSAVLRGLKEVRLGAVYLLNNDMLLEPDSFKELLPWRLPYVFAISSQIFFQETNRRREETGWTFMGVENRLPCPRHEEPTSQMVRGTVYAGAGSALYHSGLLKQLMPGSLPFDPFYWEDTDLNVRAWRMGYEILFCPASVAWHKHRATVERYYSQEEVNRIFERNRWLFKVRNYCPPTGYRELLRDVAGTESTTLAEVGSWRSCRAMFDARIRASMAGYRDIAFDEMSVKAYPSIPSEHGRPTVILVSPYAVLPPVHGGAKRIQRLAAVLSERMDVVLLSDERNLYDARSQGWFSTFSSVHLVGGRPPEPEGKARNRIARIQSHSHRRLRTELVRLMETRRPQAVILEYMELAGLVDARVDFQVPFILTLHDVLLRPDDPSQAEEDQYEQALIDQFDGVVVCSKEDQELLGPRDSRLIPNGLDLLESYKPSAGSKEILFVGPFRAPINWEGIEAFVRDVFPAIEAAVPGAILTIVGGEGAKRRVAELPWFACSSIRVLEYVEDLRPIFESCALTINPQPELRGSSLKVLESLAAGRVCVSTRAGARGAIAAGFRALIVADDLESFAEEIIRLLNDEPYRLATEAPESEKLEHFSWGRAGLTLADYVQEVVDRSAGRPE